MTRLVTPKPHTRSVFSASRATGRLIMSATFGGITFAWLTWVTPLQIEWSVRAIAGWDVASLALLAFAWTIILRADAKETRRRAGGDDPGRYIVFIIALVASLISLFAAAVVLRKLKGGEAATWTVLTLAAVALSWAVTHTAYTLRYAHLYYRRNKNHDTNSDGGLQFCGTEGPSDIDFAYFAFTIGMCFQVSDVVVTTTRMRRAVLVHAVLSFVYNTTILALALNVVFGLMSG
jgi:uncharacterized membrane protein